MKSRIILSIAALTAAVCFSSTAMAQAPATEQPTTTTKKAKKTKEATPTPTPAPAAAAAAPAAKAAPAAAKPAKPATTEAKKSGSDHPRNANVTDSDIASAKASGKVWVNTDSKVYHKDGAYYGATKQGKFMTEAEAQKAGYRAAK